MEMEQARIADMKLKYIKVCIEKGITPEKEILNIFDKEIRDIRDRKS